MGKTSKKPGSATTGLRFLFCHKFRWILTPHCPRLFDVFPRLFDVVPRLFDVVPRFVHGLSTVMCVSFFFPIFLLSGFIQSRGENPLSSKLANELYGTSLKALRDVITSLVLDSIAQLQLPREETV